MDKHNRHNPKKNDSKSYKLFWNLSEKIIFEKAWPLVPLLISLICLLFVIINIFQINGGHITYSLDDPYIHLALSENIARLHYGLNAQEFSSPSSSIIWPFILALGSQSSFPQFLPLALNFVFTLLSVHIICRLIKHCNLDTVVHGPMLCVVLSLLVIFSTNMLGVVFTGMEHTLQILLALCLVDGLIVFYLDNKIGWLLVISMLFGPWVRYENISLTLAAAAYLTFHRRWREASLILFPTVAVMALFSMFLCSMGLTPFPSSVMVKSSFLGSLMSGDPRLMMHSFANNISEAAHPPGYMLLILAVLFIWAAYNNSTHRGLALVGLFCIVAHFFAGRYGWFFRYELYIFTSMLCLNIFIYRSVIRRSFELFHPAISLVILILIFAFPTKYYAYALANTPQAANNIYVQQYQMRKAIVDFIKMPVAVNDIGLMSYRNPWYVLDLWGLASEETRILRQTSSPGWMENTIKKHKICIAIIYDSWLLKNKTPPNSWQLLARLNMAGKNVVCGSQSVSFYATNRAVTNYILRSLVMFNKHLPDGVNLVFAQTNDRPVGIPQKAPWPEISMMGRCR